MADLEKAAILATCLLGIMVILILLIFILGVYELTQYLWRRLWKEVRK